MAKKIICESCGTIFPFDRVKDMKECPVCGDSFEDDGKESEDNEDAEEESDKGLMYFEDIITFCRDKPEYNGVYAYCKGCGKFNDLGLDKFDKLVDEDYVLLKKDVTVKCEGCGKEHKPRKIMYKEKRDKVQLPHCPVCNSVVLKKITVGSKFLAAATLGAFALPHNSKTYECENCGYKF